VSFYVLKYIVPVAIPKYRSSVLNPNHILKEDLLDPSERINLLNRDYLVNGTTPAKALCAFFSRNETAQIPQLHEVPTENGAGFDLPIIMNKWYAARLISSKGNVHVLLFMPSIISGNASLISHSDLNDEVKALLGNVIETQHGHVEDLIKNRKDAVSFAFNVIESRQLPEDVVPKLAHAIKSAKKEWILFDPVRGARDPD